MIRVFGYIVPILLVATCCFGCGGGAKSHSSKSRPKEYRFLYVQPPMQATDEQQQAFMQEHFWDRFDFSDSLYTVKADTTEMLQAYASYVANFVGPLNQAPIRRLMAKASTSKSMFDYFVMLSEKILHDANSPLRSDELYIAVLEAQIASPYYDKYERMAPEYDLRIASQNRIGRPANDFEYRLASGREGSLYGVKSDFTILYINNPGCSMCRDITNSLIASPIISDMEQQGRLKVVAIYPDRDIPEWRAHLGDYPSKWINGYDHNHAIESKSLYDLKAIPALYLLDSEKRVLVKDSTDVGELEYAITQSLKQN